MTNCKNGISLEEIAKAECDPVTMGNWRMPCVKPKNREPAMEEMNEAWRFPRRQ